MAFDETVPLEQKIPLVQGAEQDPGAPVGATVGGQRGGGGGLGEGEFVHVGDRTDGPVDRPER